MSCTLKVAMHRQNLKEWYQPQCPKPGDSLEIWVSLKDQMHLSKQKGDGETLQRSNHIRIRQHRIIHLFSFHFLMIYALPTFICFGLLVSKKGLKINWKQKEKKTHINKNPPQETVWATCSCSYHKIANKSNLRKKWILLALTWENVVQDGVEGMAAGLWGGWTPWVCGQEKCRQKAVLPMKPHGLLPVTPPSSSSESLPPKNTITIISPNSLTHWGPDGFSDMWAYRGHYTFGTKQWRYPCISLWCFSWSDWSLHRNNRKEGWDQIIWSFMFLRIQLCSFS